MLDNSVRNYHKSLKQGFHKHHLLDTPRLKSTLTLWQNYYTDFYCKSQVADGFMPRKVLDVRKECVRLPCQRQTKSPLGLSVGGLFAYRHAPERLRSRTPWNKSSAHVSNTHCKPKFERKYAYCLGMPRKGFKLPRNRQSFISRASYGI